MDTSVSGVSAFCPNRVGCRLVLSIGLAGATRTPLISIGECVPHRYQEIDARTSYISIGWTQELKEGWELLQRSNS